MCPQPLHSCLSRTVFQSYSYRLLQYQTDAVQNQRADPADHRHPHRHASEEEGEHHCHHELEAATLIHTFKRQPLVVAYMLEFGIVFHSVIIGLGLGVVTGSARIVQVSEEQKE